MLVFFVLDDDDDDLTNPTGRNVEGPICVSKHNTNAITNSQMTSTGGGDFQSVGVAALSAMEVVSSASSNKIKRDVR